MKVAIIGAGNVGSAVGRAATKTGHEVIVADPEGAEKLEALGKDLGIETTNSNAEAIDDSDVVVLAVPYGAVESVVDQIADHVGDKIVLDVTNPLKGDLS